MIFILATSAFRSASAAGKFTVDSSTITIGDIQSGIINSTNA